MYYQDELLDHYHHPRNQGKLNNPDIEIVETNASCGDKITLQLTFDKPKTLPKSNRRVIDIKYLCEGCAISKASSSMLSVIAKGKTISQIQKLTQKDLEELLGSPLSPGRLKCAMLGLTALQKAVKNYTKTMPKPKKPLKTPKPAKPNDKPEITKDINLGELSFYYPEAVQILVEDYGLHCVGCMAAAFETLEEGLKTHGYTDNKIGQIVKKIKSTINNKSK